MELTIKELENLLEELRNVNADSVYLDISYHYNYFERIDRMDGIDFDAYRDNEYITTILSKENT